MMNMHWKYKENWQEGIVCFNSMGKQSWATNDKKQPLVVSDKHLTAFGNAGSRTPVIGFFSRYGAFAANSGLGRSSSSWIINQTIWKLEKWNGEFVFVCELDLESHTVPMVCQWGILSFPILQKSHSYGGNLLWFSFYCRYSNCYWYQCSGEI